MEKKMSKYKTVPTVSKISLKVPFPIEAIISLPRLGFIDNAFCMMGACGTLGIPVRRHHGAFWEQGIQNLMEDVVNEGTKKYILTMDYDTWFTHMHVLQLYWLMEAYPELDAIVPIQSRREGETPMLTLGGMVKSEETKRNVMASDFNDHDWVPIDNGHFGLTMFRANSIKKLEKPWFHSQPNEEGSWKDRRRDADMVFWDKAMDAGLKVGLATKVFIGHLQMVATFPATPEQGLRACHVKIHDLHAGDVPKWCIPMVDENAPRRGAVNLETTDEARISNS